MKQKWCKEVYMECRTSNERSGIVWLKLGILKLQGIRRGFDKGRCPFSLGDEDVKIILPVLNCR
jgi:hypothetical protein